MADTNQQSIWLDLESRFRQIQDTYIRADWHRNKTQSGVWENWSVTGTSNILGIRRFEALASLASWEELVAKEWQITRWAAKLPLSMAQLHQKRRFPFQLQGYGFGKER